MDWHKSMALLSAFWLVVSSAATPARRYPPSLEARRRSAVDRSMIRFGRSWPPPVTSAGIRESLGQQLGYGKSYSQMTDLDLNPQLRQVLFHLENYNRPEYQELPLKRQSFVRFGRTLNSDNVVHFLKSFSDEDDAPPKRAMDFIRLGRDTKFIRFGKSDPEKPNADEEIGEIKWMGDKQERIARARNHFLRLGRDAEELNVGDEATDGDRKKRSTKDDCEDC